MRNAHGRRLAPKFRMVLWGLIKAREELWSGVGGARFARKIPLEKRVNTHVHLNAQVRRGQ